MIKDFFRLISSDFPDFFNFIYLLGRIRNKVSLKTI